MDVGCPWTAPLTGSYRWRLRQSEHKKTANPHGISQIAHPHHGARSRGIQKSSGWGGLKTANQAKSEGLVEADGEFSASAKYRLTTAGIAKKKLYGGPRQN